MSSLRLAKTKAPITSIAELKEIVKLKIRTIEADWTDEPLKNDIIEAINEFEAGVRERSIKRLKEIIKIAYRLKWTYPPNKTSYPLMQLSEVEKCMIAMVDDFELGRMRKWYKDDGGAE